MKTTKQKASDLLQLLFAIIAVAAAVYFTYKRMDLEDTYYPKDYYPVKIGSFKL